MPLPPDYRPRHAAARVEEALVDTRVVIVNGARQVGKSTLTEVVARARPGSALRYLDETSTRLAAESDPVVFLRHDGLLLIDEVQRVPALWLALKASVDRDPAPGRFLLTGSARLMALRSLPDSLVGRARPSSCGHCPRVRSTEHQMRSSTWPSLMDRRCVPHRQG